MSEKELEEYQRRVEEQEELKRQIKDGKPSTAQSQIAELKRTLPHFMNGEQLEVASSVLKMVESKIEQNIELKTHVALLESMQANLTSTIKEYIHDSTDSNSQILDYFHQILTKLSTMNPNADLEREVLTKINKEL